MPGVSGGARLGLTLLDHDGNEKVATSDFLGQARSSGKNIARGKRNDESLVNCDFLGQATIRLGARDDVWSGAPVTLPLDKYQVSRLGRLGRLVGQVGQVGRLWSVVSGQRSAVAHSERRRPAVLAASPRAAPPRGVVRGGAASWRSVGGRSVGRPLQVVVVVLLPSASFLLDRSFGTTARVWIGRSGASVATAARSLSVCLTLSLSF